MPATLSEAFRSPTFDSSSYTRSSLESLKNPHFNADIGRSYNSHMIPYTNNIQHGGYITSSNTNSGSGSGSITMARGDDTISVISSSVNNSNFNDEVEEIRKKYALTEKFSDEDNEKKDSSKCDLSIYHILSCSKCRKRLKKLLIADEEAEKTEQEEFIDLIEDLRKSKKKSKKTRTRANDSDNDNDNDNDNKDQVGGLNLDFNYLLKNDNLQNVLLYVISGIFLILILDFFKRFA